MAIDTTLAACWAAASHMELDGVCASACILEVDAGDDDTGLGATTLFQLCDTDNRTAIFCDQPVRL